MSDPPHPPRTAKLAALEQARLALAANPDSVELQVAVARALDELGRERDALRQYTDVLRHDPAHVGALTAVAVILKRGGNRRLARETLALVVRTRPDHPTAHTNYAAVLYEDGDLEAARAHYEEALRLAPDDRLAHRGLALALCRLGDEEAARSHARPAGTFLTQWSHRATAAPISVLLIGSARGNNIPIEVIINDRVLHKATAVAEFLDTEEALPPVDVILNCVGDADGGERALRAIARFLEGRSERVINRPEQVLATGRAHNAVRLAALPGVVTPRVQQFPRAVLEAPDAAERLAGAGFGWPLLLRAPGFHTGDHFMKIDEPTELGPAVATMPPGDVLALQFLDARLADGLFRKYRVMMVGGRLYPLHLAISARWKVHYFTADMETSPEYRKEESVFLADMPAALGPSVMRSLERIHDALGLDYGGIDFAIDPQGQVVVWEANASMGAFPPKPDPMWRYRVPACKRVHAATVQLVVGSMRE